MVQLYHSLHGDEVHQYQLISRYVRHLTCILVSGMPEGRRRAINARWTKYKTFFFHLCPVKTRNDGREKTPTCINRGELFFHFHRKCHDLKDKFTDFPGLGAVHLMRDSADGARPSIQRLLIH